MTYNPWDNSPANETSKPSWWSSKVLLIIVLAITVLVALIVFWNLIVSHTDDVEEANIPVIAAETITIKERPDELLVEEGDSVYGLISQEKSKSSSLKTDSEDPIYETSFSPIQEEQPEVASIMKEKNSTLLEEKGKRVKNVSPENGDKTEERKQPYFLQIASLPSNQEAEQESKRLKKKHKILRSLAVKIISKDLRERGTYYRICIGPFENKKEAQKVSKNLSQNGVDCLITQ